VRAARQSAVAQDHRSVAREKNSVSHKRPIVCPIAPLTWRQPFQRSGCYNTAHGSAVEAVPAATKRDRYGAAPSAGGSLPGLERVKGCAHTQPRFSVWRFLRHDGSRPPRSALANSRRYWNGAASPSAATLMDCRSLRVAPFRGPAHLGRSLKSTIAAADCSGVSQPVIASSCVT
jgi:hypothetical protein